jgi:HSP20 family protein
MARNERSTARPEGTRTLAMSDPLIAWSDLALSPIAAFARMSRRMEELAGDPGMLTALAPPIDLTDTDDAYVLTAELPGVKKEDITIECRGNTLMLRAEKKEQRDQKGERGYHTERRYGVFTRTLTLPDEADADHVRAKYDQGVLRIEIPKKPETKARTIEIHG